MPDVCFEAMAPALGIESSVVFAMASQFADARAVIVVKRVQLCCVVPPMVAVAVRKGRPIEVIIRDSRSFSLSRLDPAESFTYRKLHTADEHDDDPLALIPSDVIMTGSPCLVKSPSVIDCEVVRHFDLEGDHELYIGEVIAVRTQEFTHVYRAPEVVEAEPDELDTDEQEVVSEFSAA